MTVFEPNCLFSNLYKTNAMPLSHTAWLNIHGLKSYIKFGLSHCCWTNKSVYMNRTLWCLTPNYKISLKYLLCIVLFPVQKMAHIFSSSFYDVWYFQTLCRYGCFGLIETHDIYFIILIEDWQRLQFVSHTRTLY